jgi:hypothetical protein
MGWQGRGGDDKVRDQFGMWCGWHGSSRSLYLYAHVAAAPGNQSVPRALSEAHTDCGTASFRWCASLVNLSPHAPFQPSIAPKQIPFPPPFLPSPQLSQKASRASSKKTVSVAARVAFPATPSLENRESKLSVMMRKLVKNGILKIRANERVRNPDGSFSADPQQL